MTFSKRLSSNIVCRKQIIKQKHRALLKLKIDMIMSLSPKWTIHKYFAICINMRRSENSTVPAIKREND